MPLRPRGPLNSTVNSDGGAERSTSRRKHETTIGQPLMGFGDFKRAFAVRIGAIAAAFVAGMVVEAVGGYSAWGVGLVTLFVGFALPPSSTAPTRCSSASTTAPSAAGAGNGLSLGGAWRTVVPPERAARAEGGVLGCTHPRSVSRRNATCVLTSARAAHPCDEDHFAKPSQPGVRLRSSRADDGRASRGLPLLLRGEGPQAPAVVAARAARRRPFDPPDDGRHAAADAVLPRPRAAARAAHDDRAEVLSDARHRRSRSRRPPPHVLRDARELLVRAVLQGGRDPAGDRVRPRASWPAVGPHLGDRARGRSGASTRAGRGRRRSLGAGRRAERADRRAPQLRELLVGR